MVKWSAIAASPKTKLSLGVIAILAVVLTIVLNYESIAYVRYSVIQTIAKPGIYPPPKAARKYSLELRKRADWLPGSLAINVPIDQREFDRIKGDALSTAQWQTKRSFGTAYFFFSNPSLLPNEFYD